ncbi:MAG: MotA/TolQ/ExbB proton channel family protein [Shimia sp.]
MDSVLSADPFELLTWSIYAALLVLSVFTVFVWVVKAITFRTRRVGRDAASKGIVDLWMEGRTNEALKAARAERSAQGRLLYGLFRVLEQPGEDGDYAEEIGQQVALGELAYLNERMRGLELIVQTAPMLGLLGTVVGMIGAFDQLGQGGAQVNAQSLAGDIDTALYTTAGGLFVAVVAYWIAAWFESRIDRERTTMERLISEVIHGRLTTPGRR